MAVRDQLERVAAWFGFGVDDDEYYEDEEEEMGYGRSYSNGSRRIRAGPRSPAGSGEAERSSAFGTSLGDLCSAAKAPARERYGNQNSSHLRAVPDNQPPPTRVSVLEPSSFNDAQALADRFKRQQPVILNLQSVDGDLSRRMVDFCAGLTYALDGQIPDCRQPRLPADPAQRRGERRGAQAARGAGVLQPVVARGIRGGLAKGRNNRGGEDRGFPGLASGRFRRLRDRRERRSPRATPTLLRKVRNPDHFLQPASWLTRAIS